MNPYFVGVFDTVAALGSLPKTLFLSGVYAIFAAAVSYLVSLLPVVLSGPFIVGHATLYLIPQRLLGPDRIKVGGVYDFGFRHDPDKPLETLAEYCLGVYTNRSLPMRIEMLTNYVNEYEADGLLIIRSRAATASRQGSS